MWTCFKDDCGWCWCWSECNRCQERQMLHRLHEQNTRWERRCLFLTFCVKDFCIAHTLQIYVWLSSACLQIVGDAVGWGFVVRGNRPCHIQAVEPQGPAALAGMKVSVTGHVATEGSPVTTKAVRSRGRSYCCEFMHQISWYCAEEIPTEAELGLYCCLYHNTVMGWQNPTLLRNWCWFEQRTLEKVLTSCLVSWSAGSPVCGFSQRPQRSWSGLPDSQLSDPNGTQNRGDGSNGRGWKLKLELCDLRVPCSSFSYKDCKDETVC